jgi:hypothetical protein
MFRRFPSPVTEKLDHNRRGLFALGIFIDGGVEDCIEFFLVASVGLSVPTNRVQQPHAHSSSSSATVKSASTGLTTSACMTVLNCSIGSYPIFT